MNKEIRTKRINWLRENCPEVMDCNPYRDYALVKHIEAKLILHSGLFPARNRHIVDSTIVGMILEIQGKKIRVNSK